MDEDGPPGRDAVADELRTTVARCADEALQRISDPTERALAATEAIKGASDLRGAMASVRREAVAAMRASGMTWPQIAKALGTSVPRAHQIVEGKTR